MSAPKGNKYALGNNGGRPRCIPIEELPALGLEMEEWFNNKLLKFKESLNSKKNEKVIVDLPFFNDFASLKGFYYTTLDGYNLPENQEFYYSYKKCKEIQKQYLILAGANNIGSATFLIFTSKNITDMRDINNLDVTTKDKEINNINISELALEIKKQFSQSGELKQ